MDEPTPSGEGEPERIHQSPPSNPGKLSILKDLAIGDRYKFLRWLAAAAIAVAAFLAIDLPSFIVDAHDFAKNYKQYGSKIDEYKERVVSIETQIDKNVLVQIDHLEKDLVSKIEALNDDLKIAQEESEEHWNLLADITEHLSQNPTNRKVLCNRQEDNECNSLVSKTRAWTGRLLRLLYGKIQVYKIDGGRHSLIVDELRKDKIWDGVAEVSYRLDDKIQLPKSHFEKLLIVPERMPNELICDLAQRIALADQELKKDSKSKIGFNFSFIVFSSDKRIRLKASSAVGSAGETLTAWGDSPDPFATIVGFPLGARIEYPNNLVSFSSALDLCKENDSNSLRDEILRAEIKS
jgi:hypothetical protein